MGKFRPYTEKDMPAVHLCAVSRKANNFVPTSVHTIVGWDDSCVLLSNQCYYTYSRLLYDFEFLDGSPCGIDEGGDMDLVDFEDEDDIVEVPKEDWSKQTIVDTESPMDDNGDYPIIETFEEYMKHAHTTEIIATTNY